VPLEGFVDVRDALFDIERDVESAVIVEVGE
jgi:hypothetical protein